MAVLPDVLLLTPPTSARLSHSLFSARLSQGTKDTWQIRSADPGITVIGSDSRVFIRNMNTGRALTGVR